MYEILEARKKVESVLSLSLKAAQNSAGGEGSGDL
jgi:hypothetical protein